MFANFNGYSATVYKTLCIRLLQHIIRHKGIYYDWSVLTTDEFDSIITKHNFPTIDRSFINNNPSLNVFNEDIFTDKSSTDETPSTPYVSCDKDIGNNVHTSSIMNINSISKLCDVHNFDT